MVFRYLLQNWLRRTATQKVRETVVETARQQMHAAAEKADQPPQECRFGLVFALGIEAGGLEDLLEEVVSTRGHGFLLRRGTLADRSLAVIRCGPGRENAARATEALITGHHPEWVISAGFAGGLNPELGRRDVLMVDQLVDTDGNRLSIDLKVERAALASAPGVHVGRLLTADRVIRLPEEKLTLGRQYEAAAVDMESFAVAEVCRRHKTRFLAVRVINDTAEEELPPDVENLLRQRSTPGRLGAAVGAIWRRPGSFKDIYQLKENALLASERLAKFLAGMIEQL